MNIMKQWPVFFLLLAFAMAPLFQGVETNVLALVYMLLLVVFIKVFLSSYQKLRIPYNSLAFFICLFYIWMALSINWSPSQTASLYMFFWLSIFPLCFFIYSLKQPDDWAYLPVGILCITLIFALTGISQEFISKNVPTSFFREKNTYAGMLNLIAQPTIAWFIISVKKRRKNLSIFLGVALFILFFAIAETGSRGAAISFAFGLTFIVFMCWRYVEKSSLLKVLIILIVAFLLADVRTDSSDFIRNESGWFDEDFLVDYNMRDRLGQLNIKENIFSARMVLWEPAWQIVKNAPIIGTGIGTYYIYQPAVRYNAKITNTGFFVHNDYLQFWLETGFIGLSLMLLTMVAISMLFMRVVRKKNLMIHDRLEMTGLMAGLSVAAIHSFVDFNFYIIAILMIMGLMCARVQEITGFYYSGLMRSFIPARKLSKKLFVLMAGIIPVIILNYILPVAIADYYWQRAKDELHRGEVIKGESTLELAAKWNPKSARVRFQQFSLYRNILKMIKNDASTDERKAILIKALLLLNKIENINSLVAIVPESRGHLLIENSDIAVEDWEEKAIGQLKKALQLDPRLYRARSALARLFVNRGDLDEAVLLINDGVKRYYPAYMTGIEKFYQYAINLNLMNGDTAKAKEIQVIIDDLNRWYSEQK